MTRELDNLIRALWLAMFIVIVGGALLICLVARD